MELHRIRTGGLENTYLETLLVLHPQHMILKHFHHLQWQLCRLRLMLNRPCQNRMVFLS